jgi:hypothetical protein
MIKLRYLSAFVAFMLVLPVTLAHAQLISGHWGHGPGCLRCAGNHQQACTCGTASCEVCNLKAETVKVKEKCFKVENKSICVPPITLPWCGKIGCARVLKVRTLASETEEVEKCEYSWEVKDLCKPAEDSKSAAWTDPNGGQTGSATFVGNGPFITPAYGSAQIGDMPPPSTNRLIVAPASNQGIGTPATLGTSVTPPDVNWNLNDGSEGPSDIHSSRR